MPPENHDSARAEGPYATKEILQEEQDLTEIVQLVGQDSLSEDQKAVLFVAKIIKDDYLCQNAYSANDYYCPLIKTVGMMKNICKFYDLSKKAINESKNDRKISWGLIHASMKENIISAISNLKFINPKSSNEEFTDRFNKLSNQMEESFRKLVHG